MPFDTPSNPAIPDTRGIEISGTEHHSLGFPKHVRILGSSEFRKVYDLGTRFSCRSFAAFYLQVPGASCSRVGFTVSRAMGKAVVRNRMKRRTREAVRLHLASLDPRWAIVFNPRKPILQQSAAAIEVDVQRLFRLCGNL